MVQIVFLFNALLIILNENENIYCLRSKDEKIFSKYIIGADGFRGVVSRFLGNKHSLLIIL